jgi:hypothetical protein
MPRLRPAIGEVLRAGLKPRWPYSNARGTEMLEFVTSEQQRACHLPSPHGDDKSDPES